ncbi:helix-turn-helix domain-containing protein [Nocardia sp. BMG51109]|uniref:AraC family transcriptional regulator n=1 Tax=Nocardia sp. BMG51109 TaxID=1056816 RepID=UPI0004B4F018|nr:helix-turn-helix domain-containing protein [Nocardia sp. BMG51109]
MFTCAEAVGAAGSGQATRIDVHPHPQLRPALLQQYRGYPITSTPHRRDYVPAGTVVRLIIKLVDSAQRPPEFLIGARDRYVPIDGPCAPSYIELSLSPLGAFTLFGIPGIELNNQLADLSDVIGCRYRGVVERIRDQHTWHGRFNLLDNFLLERLENGSRPLPEVQQAWSLLSATGGAIPIRRIAQDVGWSHKHLITKFTHHVGLTPKTAARLIRFDRARQHMLLAPQARLIDIAATYGYADQSHFTREFRQFTSTTPTGYLGSNPEP